MAKLREALEAQPMSDDTMRRMLGARAQDTLVTAYDDLRGVSTFHDLFAKHRAAIVLLQMRGTDNPVGHWIALLNKGRYVEHFDPYGIGLDEELDITHEDRHLARIQEHSQVPLVETTEQLQHMRDHTNTCGRWCVARVLLQDLDHAQFGQLFAERTEKADDAVALATMLLDR